MSFEHQESVDIIERRRELKDNFGIALSTRQKEGENMSLENQVEVAGQLELPSVQFDLRNRTTDEIHQALEALHTYKELHSFGHISIHGETPRIDESNLSFKNKDRITGELYLVQELLGESYTVHPPAINAKMFSGLPQDVQEKIIDNYSSIFVEAIQKAVVDKKKFSLAIENMPNKGDEGAWGQTVEDVLFLIKKIESTLVEQGIDPDLAHEYVGATLDVNHALHGVEPKDAKAVLESWFKNLGEYLKVVHLHTPSSPSESFVTKYEWALEFASQYNPRARLFMESKQDAQITTDIYRAAKEVQ